MPMSKEQKKQALRNSRNKIFAVEDKGQALLRKQDRILTKINLEGSSLSLEKERKKVRVQIDKILKESSKLKKTHTQLRNKLLKR